MTQSKRSWMRIALVVSLALNLLIAGGAIGALLRGPDHRPGPRTLDLSMGALTRALSDSDRVALRQQLMKDPRVRGGARPPSRQARQAEIRQMIVTLRQDPFEAEALSAVLAEQQSRARRLTDLGQAALVAHLSGLSAADRAAYADRLEADLRRAPAPRKR